MAVPARTVVVPSVATAFTGGLGPGTAACPHRVAAVRTADGGEVRTRNMASLQMRAVAVVLRLAYKPRMATAQRARKRIAGPKGSSEPPAVLRKRHDVSTRLIEGFPCHTVAPRNTTSARAAVYLHGGAYIGEIAPQHWALISRLADAGVRVEVPIYGLAPLHTYREAYPLLTAVHRQLIGEFGPSAVTFVGDSAGAAWRWGSRRPWARSVCHSPGG